METIARLVLLAALAVSTSACGLDLGEPRNEAESTTTESRPRRAKAPYDRRLPVRGGIETTQSRIEPRLSRAVDAALGGDADVRCYSAADWRKILDRIGPHADFTGLARGFAVHLSPVICKPLVELAYRGRSTPLSHELVTALGVFAHEIEHHRGAFDERETECLGMQNIALTARVLGLRAGAARRAARWYWRAVYPRNPPGYRSRQCRDGGLLDANPRSNVWP